MSSAKGTSLMGLLVIKQRADTRSMLISGFVYVRPALLLVPSTYLND